MKNKRSEKQIQILVFILIAIITLGIGYTAISSIILSISGNARADVDEANFKVHFDRNVSPTITANMGSASIDEDNDKLAHISVIGLKKAGDSATAEYTIINESNGIGAQLSIDLVNTNTEYFKVTETLDDIELQAGETTKVRIIVELLETPTDTALETEITGTIEAKAIKNTEANSNDSASKTAGDPESFATDSWKTIQKAVKNNNTSAYKVGDTKTVKINGNDYTVRIVNKSTNAKCDNENYSQTACGFVVEFADIIEIRVMDSSFSNIGGWPESELYSFLQDPFYNSLPSDLKSSIKSTRVISSHGLGDSSNFVTTDKLYLLSGVEIHGADQYDTAASTTHQLDYYVGQPIEQILPCGQSCGVIEDSYPRARKQYNGSYDWYWLRTAYSDNNTDFRDVKSNGDMHNGDSDYNYGFAPAFRIG